MRKSSTGTRVIAKIKKENDQGTYILLNGRGATPEGDVPFLDLFNINTGSKERIWESDKEKYYETAVSLILDQSVGDKELIKYQRKDGVQLTAKLYLPTGYDPSKDGHLLCLFWAYPGEFRSKDAAGQKLDRVVIVKSLSCRFAVLAGPSVPIIGEGDEEPNDRFVEQLVSSAEAAVEEVVRRGVAHPSKIAVGGLSYGGFMTANLLAHAPPSLLLWNCSFWKLQDDT
ncbi:hypothetical protein WN943_005910 [Citrus x changshan-huyou]